MKPEADDQFLEDLLGEVDANIPTPVPRTTKRQRSPERRRVRALSPAPETRQPSSKKPKTIDDRLPLTPQGAGTDDDMGYMVTPAEAVDASSWNDLTNKLNTVSSSPTESRNLGKIDYKDAVEEDGSLNMFWTDYTEVNGSLCLFGKVLNKKTGAYVSCFVKVDNILRKVYFLPRKQRQRDGEDTDEEVDMMAVYNEVDEIMTKMNVKMHKIKACTRKYAFELPNVPKEGQYLKLLYPYSSKSLWKLCLHV